MTSITSGLYIHNANARAVDLSNLKKFELSKAPEDLYQRMVQGQEKILESKHSNAAGFSNSAANKDYAVVEVNGRIVARINNQGYTQTSNALANRLSGKGMPGDVNGQKGPVLAQARAEFIADLLGGKVVKSSTALTQGQYNAASLPHSVVDLQAMQADPMYQQLQKTKAARTLYIAQRIGQEDVKTASGDAAENFLEYMEKSPAERYYDMILREKGLTKEDLKTLGPEERAKLEKEIQEEIKMRMVNNADEKGNEI